MNSAEMNAAIVATIGAAGALLRWLLNRRRSIPSPGLLRRIAAHLDRERQHAETVAKLWRAEDDQASQSRQIEIMDERIEGLLDQLRDASFASSFGKNRRPPRSRKPTSASSNGSTASSTRRNPK